MIIRLAMAADIPEIMTLERAVPEAAHWSRAQYESATAASAVPRVCMVLENESRVEGFLIARQVDDEWEVENLAVSNSQRRRGFGSRLLGAFLEWARDGGGKSVFLEVRRSNCAARAVYEKCGFIHSGSRPDYYQDPPEDAVLYFISSL